MRTPIKRKAERVLYYLRNAARDSIPQSIFHQRLPEMLADAGSCDAAHLAARLHYYNKLDRRIPLPDDAVSIAGIPMGQSRYYYDLKEHARYFPRHLRLHPLFGDITHVPGRPSIVKSRPVDGDNRNSVILNLDKFRHFYFPPDPLPFIAKNSIAVWRGGETSRRWRLVERYHSHPLCDVGFAGANGIGAGMKNFMSPAQQLRCRYVISIEGNDVATNLKWIMASNSLCLMNRPTCETWFMEGRLEAGKHYVLLREDFGDLEEKVLHYERHPDEAMAIIRNAHAHVAQFKDERREQLLSLLVLQKYFLMTSQMEPVVGVPAMPIPSAMPMPAAA